MENVKKIAEMLRKIQDPKLRDSTIELLKAVKDELVNKPASVKYHHKNKGGLGRHTREVMEQAITMYNINPELYACTLDQVILASFVHDFNKLDKYNELPVGDWRRQPKYGAKEFEYSSSKIRMNETADVVLYCAKHGLILDELVVNAVTYHHGGWSADFKDSVGSMSRIAVLIHSADLISTVCFG